MAALTAAAPALAQQRAPSYSQDRAVEQQVRRALQGPDLEGKDGPMAKVDAGLVTLYYEQQLLGGQRALAQSRTATQTSRDGYVRIDATARRSGAALLGDLRALGLERGASAGTVVSGWLPVEAIERAAKLRSLRFARPSLTNKDPSATSQVPGVEVGAPRGSGGGETPGAQTNAQGDAASQGGPAMNVPEAREQYGVDGSGITVGVLSDSYDADTTRAITAADDMASGDLPDSVNVLQDALNPGAATDEGRAMLQLIHDVAPGSDLAFHTANGGQANFANGIGELRQQAGSGVIVDDVFYFAEPFFQDGIIAQAVDQAVADGAAYFSSAGNSAADSYESEFRPSGEGGLLSDTSSAMLHDFDPGAGVDTRLEITIPVGAVSTYSFQWDEPYFSATGNPEAAATNDLDIFLIPATNPDSLVFISGAASNNIASGDPIEVFRFTNDGSLDFDEDGMPDETFSLVIEYFASSTGQDEYPDFMKFVDFDGGTTPNEYTDDHFKSTVIGHSNAAGTEAVGAAPYFNTPAFNRNVDVPLLEGFSSLGGTPIFFDEDGDRLSTPEVRQKPQIVGPDGTNNTFFGTDLPPDPFDDFGDNDSFPNFFGTSAAAPHAAAVAALVREGRPDLTPAEIYENMESTAVDMNNPFNGGGPDPGFDFATGFGFVDALALGEIGSLPVELAGFDGVADDGDVVLTWRTLSETNNQRFRILQEKDGSFVEVGTKPSRVEGGTTNEAQDYAFRVTGVTPGLHTFRLTQVDLDGTEHPGDDTTVEVSLNGAFYLSNAYPNPFSERARLDLTVQRAQEVRVSVYDALGRRVAVPFEGVLEANDAQAVTLEGSDLASGLYLVRVSGEDFTETRTVTLVR